MKILLGHNKENTGHILAGHNLRSSGFIEYNANPGFDTDTVWSKGAGWAISGGSANSAGSNNLEQVSQVVARQFLAGVTYNATVIVTGYVSGELRPRLIGGGQLLGPAISANGTYEFDLTPGTNLTTSSLLSSGGSGVICSVELFSILGPD